VKDVYINQDFFRIDPERVIREPEYQDRIHLNRWGSVVILRKRKLSVLFESIL